MAWRKREGGREGKGGDGVMEKYGNKGRNVIERGKYEGRGEE